MIENFCVYYLCTRNFFTLNLNNVYTIILHFKKKILFLIFGNFAIRIVIFKLL